MKPQTPHIVYWTILTTITIVFWVGFSVYRIFTSKPAPQVPPEVIKTFSPTLSKETIDKIQDRVFFEENQIAPTQTTSPSISPTSSPKPTLSPVATNLASPKP